MGLFFHKSFRAGPIRINMSGSGIGASIGVPGFRYSFPARGRHYLRIGTGSVYYRQSLPSPSTPTSQRSTPSPTTVPSAPGQQTVYETKSTAGLVPGPRSDMITQLNEARQRIPWHVLILMVVVLSTGYLAYLLPEVPGPITFIAFGTGSLCKNLPVSKS